MQLMKVTLWLTLNYLFTTGVSEMETFTSHCLFTKGLHLNIRDWELVAVKGRARVLEEVVNPDFEHRTSSL